MSDDQGLERARALLDPLRWDIYDALFVDGPMTTAELRDRFPESRGALSYDLKDLASVGHLRKIEGDPPKWEAILGSMAWNDAMLRNPATAAAVAELDRVVMQKRLSRMRDWMNHRAKWGPEWGSASLSADYLAKMTPPELDEMRRELEQVASKHRRAAEARRAGGDGMDGERTVFTFLIGFPCRIGDSEEPG